MTALSGRWVNYYCCCVSHVAGPLGSPCQLLQPLLCVFFSVLSLHVPAVGQEQTTESCAPCHTLGQRAAVQSPEHWWFGLRVRAPGCHTRVPASSKCVLATGTQLRASLSPG